ncbi:MAG: hypothetical protein HY394_05555 [Candidatus Diapherotrites archaeon]|nr:hypothetical protein [Candidatus Diapherotrites archaeon]
MPSAHKVLWLEEDDSIAELVRVNAPKWFPGAQVFVAETPEQAREYLAHNAPRIVFGEIWRGDEIHERFRDLMLEIRRRAPDCRLVVVSTHGPKIAEHVPGSAHIGKPFRPEQLTTHYREAIRQRRSPR